MKAKFAMQMAKKAIGHHTESQPKNIAQMNAAAGVVGDMAKTIPSRWVFSTAISAMVEAGNIEEAREMAAFVDAAFPPKWAHQGMKAAVEWQVKEAQA